ncbi:hypothetical protein ACIGKM_12105 [Ectopseudomonas toyotomiensis]|uniref:ORC-CDC6 family AAA ATPase n=1 Tax=Ectopseudomonas toyotomiensis TaxID=554344 RepID=UPI0037CA9CB9
MNPFSIKTPETLTPENIASLFVDVFSDFPRILAQEHTFIQGARGTGKSMMLRYLEPLVQLAARQVSEVSELKHFSVHVPIKTANYSLAELERLDGAPYWLLAEHLLILNASYHIASSVANLFSADEYRDNLEAKEYIKSVIDLIGSSGGLTESSVNNDLRSLSRLFSRERAAAKTYVGRLSFIKDMVPYEGAIFSYEDFFLPYIRLTKELSFSPNGPIFLMLDDADNLPLRMQQILNDWVSYRTTNDICLKVSVQKKYKTWRTSQGILIESPHDYADIDINTFYTSKQYSNYYDRIEKIVHRRLEVAGFENTNPVDFFPSNDSQDKALSEIAKKIKLGWENGEKVSSRKSDDVRRYAVSEYLKLLAKDKKTNMYSYAGFRTLVDLSSGMVRFFLESASRMYSELQSNYSASSFDHIPTDVQDRVLYKWSEEYALAELDKIKSDESSKSIVNLRKVERLKRLINSFGECFQKKLVSSDSERHFISFMVTKETSYEVQEVLDLAIEWGYLTVKTMARKEGAGRNLVYTMNRRLAPHFKLDPSGYAAHMSVTPEHLLLAIENPRAFISARLKEAEPSFAAIQKSLNFED